MKFSAIVLPAFVALVAAAPLDEVKPKEMGSMQMSDPSDSSSGFKKVGKQEEVDGVIFAPDLGNSAVTPGASFVKLRYGPYKMKAGKMTNTGGIMKRPCSSCYIIAQQAGLEYEDGSEANIDTGAWLHHMVATNSGAKGIGCVPGERFFASGNEREPRRFNDYGNWGYYVSPLASFMSVIELMSESTEDKEVWMTMKYEYLPEAKASGYKKITPIWMDITGTCGVSEEGARQGKATYTSPKWRSTSTAGRLLISSGHMHDGGINIQMLQNGKEICNSKMVYGAKPAYVEKAGAGMAGMSSSTGPMTHISEQGLCANFGDISAGDTLQIIANYDSTLHPLMHEGRGLMPIMGIALTYVGEQ